MVNLDNECVKYPLLILALLTSTTLADTWTVDDDGKVILDNYLEAENPHTYKFKKRHSLNYDLTRIAIQIKVDNKLFWDNINLPIGSIEPSPIKNWFLLTLPNESRTIDDLVRATTMYAELDDVKLASPVFIDSFGNPLIPTSVILMQFDHNSSIKQVNELLTELDAEPVTEQAWSTLPNSYKVRSRSKNGFDVIAQSNALAERADVLFAEPDTIFTGIGHGTPNDPGFFNCWGLDNTGQSGGVPDMDMDSLESWNITAGDESILVMILDTGIEQDHPDINQIEGMDFTSDSSTNGDPVNECDNHGTLVAGCVSAIINNNLGTVGSAPNVNSVSARCYIHVLTADCSGGWTAKYSWTADALDWGLTIGVRVTNNSNGFGGRSAAVESMYEATRDAGMVHFASAGNDSSPTIHYPANLPTVNAVAALDRNGQLASFSNWGIGLAISAPGVSIYTTDRTGADGRDPGDYDWGSGTSYASPYTAGVAALVLSENPLLAASQVENILYYSAGDLGIAGYDTTYGWGFVNANDALNTIVGGCPSNEIEDCYGNCCPETWIGDSYCDDGSYSWNGIPIYLNCEVFECDGGDCDCAGVTWTVDDNGTADFNNIQAAVDAASDGDEIIVMPGTYTGNGDQVVDMHGKELWLHSSAGPEVTIIDGDGIRRGIVCVSGETSYAIISGFTVTDCNGEDGGGIYCSLSSPGIQNCLFINNTSNDDGAGAYFDRCGTVLTNCIFDSNLSTDEAGGLYAHRSDLAINNCTFTNNSGDYAGALYCWSSSPIIKNSNFTNNIANYGGALRCKSNSNPILENCTLMNNTANYDGGGMYNTSDSIPALVYTLVCANNPNQIVGPWTDDGDNTIADECPECPDINGDGTVDVSDLLIVIGYWGATGSPADLNSDGIVDVADLLIVIGNWGPCN